MNKKYERYIDYIVNELEPPYFINMKDNYGLSEKEYPLVLSKIFNEPVIIKGRYVYNNQGNEIYYEDSDGYWYKQEYGEQGNEIYFENRYGYWEKYEYDEQGYITYYENSDGEIRGNRYE